MNIPAETWIWITITRILTVATFFKKMWSWRCALMCLSVPIGADSVPQSRVQADIPAPLHSATAARCGRNRAPKVAGFAHSQTGSRHKPRSGAVTPSLVFRGATILQCETCHNFPSSAPIHLLACRCCTLTRRWFGDLRVILQIPGYERAAGPPICGTFHCKEVSHESSQVRCPTLPGRSRDRGRGRVLRVVFTRYRNSAASRPAG